MGRPAGRRTPCIYGRRHVLDAGRLRRPRGHPLRRAALGPARGAHERRHRGDLRATDRARAAAQRLAAAVRGAVPVSARPHHRHDFLAASRRSVPWTGGRVLQRLRRRARTGGDLPHPRGRRARALGAVLARWHDFHRRLRRVLLVPRHPPGGLGHRARLPAPGTEPGLRRARLRAAADARHAAADRRPAACRCCC